MAPVDNHRLDSWKEIADYLRRDITTVIRWERERGLPVHRVPGGKRHAVFAYPQEIDVWLSNGRPGANHAALAQTEDDVGDPAVAGPPLQKTGDGPAPAGPPLQQTNGGVNPPLQTGRAAAGARTEETTAPTLEKPRSGTARRRYGVWLGAAAGLALAVVAADLSIWHRPSITVAGYTQLTNDGFGKGGRMFCDGARVYFVETRPEGEAIVAVSVSGGDVVTVSTSLRNPGLLDFGQARSEFLVLEDPVAEAATPLWAISSSGGLPRRVGNIRAQGAAWSPDGNAIAYSTGSGLFLAKPDGSESRKIATAPGIVEAICWSPDGERLRFDVEQHEAHATNIWEARQDSSGLHPLFPVPNTSDGENVDFWTSGGGLFGFTLSKGGRPSLWLLPERRGVIGWGVSRPVELNIGPPERSGFAASPDGTRIFVTGQKTRSELLRFNSASKQFSPILPAVSGDMADFSGDREWLAYLRFPDNCLWRRKSDGSLPVQLTFPPMIVELPRWSPDGKWIAFMGKNLDGHWRVYVIPAQGGEVVAAPPTGFGQGAPTWSPDGSKLMFGDLISDSTKPADQMTIHLLDLKTRTVTSLPGSNGLWTARWSLDGLKVAALSADSKSLMVSDFRTGQWKELARGERISDLNWSRKSDAVYFNDSLAPTGTALYRLHVGSRKVERLAVLEPAVLAHSFWLGLAPDDLPLISSSVGSQEVYALRLKEQ